MADRRLTVLSAAGRARRGASRPPCRSCSIQPRGRPAGHGRVHLLSLLGRHRAAFGVRAGLRGAFGRRLAGSLSRQGFDSSRIGCGSSGRPCAQFRVYDLQDDQHSLSHLPRLLRIHALAKLLNNLQSTYQDAVHNREHRPRTLSIARIKLCWSDSFSAWIFAINSLFLSHCTPIAIAIRHRISVSVVL